MAGTCSKSGSGRSSVKASSRKRSARVCQARAPPCMMMCMRLPVILPRRARCHAFVCWWGFGTDTTTLPLPFGTGLSLVDLGLRGGDALEDLLETAHRDLGERFDPVRRAHLAHVLVHVLELQFRCRLLDLRALLDRELGLIDHRGVALDRDPPFGLVVEVDRGLEALPAARMVD